MPKRGRERGNGRADGSAGLALGLVAVEQLADVLHAHVVGLDRTEHRQHVQSQPHLVGVGCRGGARGEHAALAGDEVLDERVHGEGAVAELDVAALDVDEQGAVLVHGVGLALLAGAAGGLEDAATQAPVDTTNPRVGDRAVATSPHERDVPWPRARLGQRRLGGGDDAELREDRLAPTVQ